MGGIYLVALTVCTSCVASNVVTCDNGHICAAGTVCDVTHDLCVSQQQFDDCVATSDGAACTLSTGDGACHDGVCLPAACGNGRRDRDEVCDDGNTLPNDGCSADCTSMEICGNGIVDLVKGETCDDSNALDHDGCSSACRTEQPRWTELPQSSGQRIQAMAALDGTRGRVMVFGGVDIDDGVWEWDGRWLRPAPIVSPPTRYQGGMSFDAHRRRVVLFGGANNFSVQGDTWEWDGQVWKRGADGPARVGPAMAYDGSRRQVIVFGGADNDGNISAETYGYDGMTWTRITTPTTPISRRDAAMSYDPIRHVTLMYGGTADFNLTDELWKLDGNDWHLVQPTGPRPPPLRNTAMAWDAIGQRTILFGGDDLLDTSDFHTNHATWAWDGTAWTQLPDGATYPPDREDHCMVTDATGHVLMFGGDSDGSKPVEDTWQLTETGWEPRQTPSISNANVANDLGRGVVVLFGGYAGQTVGALDTTYELRRDGWHAITGLHPSARFDEAIAYDPIHREVVMFGGATSPDTTIGDTWTYDGVWTQHVTPIAPNPRQGASFAFDPTTQRMILIGGGPADMWAWDGTAWTQMTPAHVPARINGAMAGDPIRHQLVLFGGDARNDTWVWDGTDWHEVTTVSLPQGSAETLSWDFARGALIKWGAAGGDAWEWTGTDWRHVDAVTHPPLHDTERGFASLDGSGVEIIGGSNDTPWQLSWASDHASDVCVLAVDGDGDGRAGCADPDCWATCTPACPPGLPCDPSAARCGDGTCDPSETCRSCAADCACTPICGDGFCDVGETCASDCAM